MSQTFHTSYLIATVSGNSEGSAPKGCETELLTPFVDTFDTAIVAPWVSLVNKGCQEWRVFN